ncbi:MAG TPA: serine/threonine-protein kinase, partial [Polyangiaceae bacterium]|nr:serine/threonine-protein kinase [Polyangiaceae bacterium]
MNSSFPNPSTWAPGTLIPGTPYRVVRPLGQGGMGEVFEVEHDLLGTRRALKVLARHFAGRSDLEERLRVEARALARLKHPNLVEVYDLAAASDGRIFFVMELLDGCTLRDLVRHRGKLGASAAVRVVAQALDGLAAAHSTQMVHRDVKPENVFVCRSGIVKLLDFGIAKAIDASMPAQQITGAGMTVGTPRYMAPEQATGTAVDKRADVYAAGLVLWEALTGRPAFPGDDVHEIIAAKVDEGLPALDPSLGVPVELEAAIARACAPSPAVRFATADAFATELRRAVGEPLEPWALVVTPQPDPALGQLGDLSAIRGAHVASHAIAGPPGAPTVNERGPVVPRRVSDAALTELTQGIEGLVPVDRDAPTPAAMESVPMTGPTGTEMLPAVAEQNAATRLALAAAPPSVPPPCAAHSGGLQPE